METTVSWSGPALDEAGSGMGFVARTGSGHLVTMDGAPADDGGPLGGRNLAPRPMELVLAGTGGCAAYDVVLILRRGRHAVTRCDVTLEAERAPSDPRVFTSIHFHFVVVGTGLKNELVERAIRLSHEKFCSASVMLAKTAALTHTFEIREA
ncbi:MAG: OsmC family protein [Burkholderiaceae bacterium]